MDMGRFRDSECQCVTVLIIEDSIFDEEKDVIQQKSCPFLFPNVYSEISEQLSTSLVDVVQEFEDLVPFGLEQCSDDDCACDVTFYIFSHKDFSFQPLVSMPANSHGHRQTISQVRYGQWSSPNYSDLQLL